MVFYFLPTSRLSHFFVFHFSTPFILVLSQTNRATPDKVGAHDAYAHALELEPSNVQAKSGLAAVDAAIRREAEEDGAQPDLGLGSIFADPAFITKLAANPKTSALLRDADFMAKLNRVRQNPTAIQDELRDPRMMQVIAALLGIQMDMPEAPEAAAAGEAASRSNNSNNNQNDDSDMPDAPSYTPEPEEDGGEARAEREAKAAAENEKAIGTQNYKQRNFGAAIEHYSKAWDLFKDITYLNNLAAAKFEAGDCEGCIQECLRAIEEGRNMRADFKLVAKYDAFPLSSSPSSSSFFFPSRSSSSFSPPPSLLSLPHFLPLLPLPAECCSDVEAKGIRTSRHRIPKDG